MSILRYHHPWVWWGRTVCFVLTLCCHILAKYVNVWCSGQGGVGPGDEENKKNTPQSGCLNFGATKWFAKFYPLCLFVFSVDFFFVFLRIVANMLCAIVFVVIAVTRRHAPFLSSSCWQCVRSRSPQAPTRDHLQGWRMREGGRGGEGLSCPAADARNPPR